MVTAKENHYQKQASNLAYSKMNMAISHRSGMEWETTTQEMYSYCSRINRISCNNNRNSIKCNNSSNSIFRRIQVVQRYSKQKKKMLRRMMMITAIITTTISQRVIYLRTTKHCTINWKCNGMIQKNKNAEKNRIANLATTADGSRRDKAQVKHRLRMRDILTNILMLMECMQLMIMRITLCMRINLEMHSSSKDSSNSNNNNCSSINSSSKNSSSKTTMMETEKKREKKTQESFIRRIMVMVMKRRGIFQEMVIMNSNGITTMT